MDLPLPKWVHHLPAGDKAGVGGAAEEIQVGAEGSRVASERQLDSKACFFRVLTLLSLVASENYICKLLGSSGLVSLAKTKKHPLGCKSLAVSKWAWQDRAQV